METKSSASVSSVPSCQNRRQSAAKKNVTLEVAVAVPNTGSHLEDFHILSKNTCYKRGEIEARNRKHDPRTYSPRTESRGLTKQQSCLPVWNFAAAMQTIEPM